MCLSDVKRAILKNVHIIRIQELMRNYRSTFDEKWKVLIDCLRTDPATKHSWYTIKNLYWIYTSTWLEMNILKPNPIYRRGPNENEWHSHCHKCAGTKKYIYHFLDTKYCYEIYFCIVFKWLWRIKILFYICAIWNL